MPNIVARMSEATSGKRPRISLRSCGLLRWRKQRGLKGAGNCLFALAGTNRISDRDHALLLVAPHPQFLCRPGARLVIEPVAKARPRQKLAEAWPAAYSQVEH